VVVTKISFARRQNRSQFLSAVTARLPLLPFGESGDECRLAAGGLDEQKHTAGPEPVGTHLCIVQETRRASSHEVRSLVATTS